MMEIRLNPIGSAVALVMRGGASVFGDERGFVVGPDGFKGWDDGVSFRSNRADRPTGHGQFHDRGFMDARVVTISGHAFAGSAQELDSMRWKLTGFLSDGEKGRITVDHLGSTTWADCDVTDVKFEVLAADATVARFQISLVCVDPRRYGETRRFGAGDMVFHRGNAHASPIITVSGSVPSGGYVVWADGGKHFRVLVPLVAGRPHVIDMATGYIMVNGSVVPAAGGDGRVWTIPGGRRMQHTVSSASGSASISIAVKDTWI